MESDTAYEALLSISRDKNFNLLSEYLQNSEPITIKLNNFLLFLRSNKSFLKKNIIANKEPKCKLISINNELDFNSYKLEIIIKCADELIGKNSEIP